LCLAAILPFDPAGCGISRWQGRDNPWSIRRSGGTIGCPPITGGETLMSEPDHIDALKQQHAALERAIDEENARPHPDDDTIADLKRQKLRIKDQLYQLERH